MKYNQIIFSLFLFVAITGCSSDEWISLFDGESFEGWTANENASSWVLEDGAIVTAGERSHLFYTGEVMNHNFKNLVFEGGGVKGIAYGGALDVLDKMKILSSVIRVAGTSAGAINAVLVALGYTSAEVSKIIADTNFKDLKTKASYRKMFMESSRNLDGTKVMLLKNGSDN